jgi:hypothetical protein
MNFGLLRLRRTNDVNALMNETTQSTGTEVNRSEASF